MRTFVAKPAEAQASRQWWIVDAEGQSLGRVASRIAAVLRGKHKPIYTPHVDTGDFVIVLNAAKVKVTGNKATDKVYWRHSGYPGGTSSENFEHLVVRKPTAPIELAVRGMLPKNPLGRSMFRKLKVYAAAEHPHVAQKPQMLPL